MDDDIDARLRDYAARWQAGEPADPTPVRSWARGRPAVGPALLTAAVVIALVVGIGVAAWEDASDLDPSVTASATATPACEAESLRWSAGFTARGTGAHEPTSLDGELRVTNTGTTPCSVAEPRNVSIHRGAPQPGSAVATMRAAGSAPSTAHLLAPQRAMVRALRWMNPACGTDQPLVLLVSARAGDGAGDPRAGTSDDSVRLPLDPHVLDPCPGTSPTGGGCVQGEYDDVARCTSGPPPGSLDGFPWVTLAEDSPCSMDDFEVDASVERDPQSGVVTFTLDLVNAAGRPCDTDVKPMPYLVVRGRRLTGSHFVTSDGQIGPPLRDRGAASAQVLWSSYCAQQRHLEYELWVEIAERPGAVHVPLPAGAPIPVNCTPSTSTDFANAHTSSGWIEPR